MTDKKPQLDLVYLGIIQSCFIFIGLFLGSSQLDCISVYSVYSVDSNGFKKAEEYESVYSD